MAVKKKINELTIRERFSNLLPTDAEVTKAIIAGMKEEGFDATRAIYVWKDGREWVVVDGHTRLEAARKAGIKEVMVTVRKFKDEDEAVDFAYSEQLNRRNMPRDEIIARIYAEEKQRQNGSSKDHATVAKSLREHGPPKGQKGGGGSTKDPVKQRTIERATRAMGKKPAARTVDRGIAKAKGKAKRETMAGYAVATPKEEQESRKHAAASVLKALSYAPHWAGKGMTPSQYQEFNEAVAQIRAGYKAKEKK